MDISRYMKKEREAERMTSWKSQCGGGLYRLQFETDDRKAYEIMEKCAQMAIDATPYLRAHWESVPRRTELKRCSNCKACDNPYYNRYCGNCGAKMDEEVDGE